MLVAYATAAGSLKEPPQRIALLVKASFRHTFWVTFKPIWSDTLIGWVAAAVTGTESSKRNLRWVNSISSVTGRALSICYSWVPWNIAGYLFPSNLDLIALRFSSKVQSSKLDWIVRYALFINGWRKTARRWKAPWCQKPVERQE